MRDDAHIPLIVSLDGECRGYGSPDGCSRDDGGFALYGNWGEWGRIMDVGWDFTVKSRRLTHVRPDGVSLYQSQWELSMDTKRGEKR